MPLRWVSREDTTERRRASEDYGLRKPKRPKPKQHRTPWQRHKDRHKRVWRATRRHYRKHKHKRGAVAAGGGALGLGVLAVMWAFQGTVSLVTLGVCGGALVGGYALHKHDEAKVMRGTRKTTEADRIRHAWNPGARQPYHRRPATPEEPGTGKVRVTSHTRDGDGVKAYYRSRPGQGGDEQPGGGWSAADTKAEGKRKPRTWDGSPETPADTRFFDHRESGYKGPIDQDGHRADKDPDGRPAWRDRYDQGKRGTG